MVRVFIKKLDPKVTLPSYKTKGASGMDLMAFVKEKIVIKPQDYLSLSLKIMKYK